MNTLHPTPYTIPIGTITRVHGTQGEVQMHTVNTLFDESDPDFVMLQLDGLQVPFRVTDWRGKGEDLLLTLKGVTTETKAATLVGAEVSMQRCDICHEEEDEEMTWQELQGWTLQDADTGEQWRIASIDESTLNTLACLDDDRLIPLHEDLIESLNEDQQILTIHIAAGI